MRLQFLLTIFLSAFLLFSVQPLMGKFLLPWFGGGASVWATTLAFFQTALVLGYVYAHVVRRFMPGRHHVVHAGVVAASLLLLPFAPQPPADTERYPALLILTELTVTIGVPYVLLAATSPLMQAWAAAAWPRRSSYRLYALSNAGSLLALVSYPLIIEPSSGRVAQLGAWSVAYATFAALLVHAALRTRSVRHGAGGTAPADPAARDGHAAARAPGWLQILGWTGMAAIGSSLLMAVTNQLTQEVAGVPLLWVVPLAIYLLTMIVSFDRARWYRPWLFALLLGATTPVAIWALRLGPRVPYPTQIVIFGLLLFASCMLCHGELARAKPHPRFLTVFYLAVAVGGAAGGAMVALALPLLLEGRWDLWVALLACWVCAAIRWIRAPDDLTRSVGVVRYAVPLLAMGAILVQFDRYVAEQRRGLVHATRDFYGVLGVSEYDEGDLRFRILTHGQIEHGRQFLDPARHSEPTAYYGRESGGARAIVEHPRRATGPVRVGIVGVGVGTLATYGRDGDRFVFWELSPAVERIAREFFTFLDDSPADIDVRLGDARLAMERQLRAGSPERFDVLAIDAFNSDAIPVHLLTREALEVYWSLLEPDGVLAIHHSNRFMELGGIVEALARDAGIDVVHVESPLREPLGVSAASWSVLVRDNPALLASLGDGTTELDTDVPRVLWTDDRASLWPALSFDVR